MFPNIRISGSGNTPHLHAEFIVLNVLSVKNRLATKPVMLKVCNVKLSFDIWLILYIYTSYYTPNTKCNRPHKLKHH